MSKITFSANEKKSLQQQIYNVSVRKRLPILMTIRIDLWMKI
ncbi:hypothetical protein [Bacillus sp. SM2101]|nr:hypothetical protein [Bacillus sp. SM2101]